MQYKNKLVEGSTEKVMSTIENNVILRIIYCFNLFEIFERYFKAKVMLPEADFAFIVQA
jgi:hypothetical protein